MKDRQKLAKANSDLCATIPALSPSVMSLVRAPLNSGAHTDSPLNHTFSIGLHLPNPKKTHQLLQNSSSFGFFRGYFVVLFQILKKIPQGSVGLPIHCPSSYSKPISRTAFFPKEQLILNP